MATLQDPLVGQVLADRFEILSRIGEGGIGVVYKARQITVDRIIAIKLLNSEVSSDPSWVKRFHNEARAAARLDHPNTVRLIDFGETKTGQLFIAMEYLQGHSLAEEIARVGRLSPQRMLHILSQMCQSLQEAHAQGIIHRDVKPDNVFLVETKGAGDFVKVLDFSVAKMDEPGGAQVTTPGTVFGTPEYMSPEQSRGHKLSAQSDLYSCGVVAYEMLTGKPPFEAQRQVEVLTMHLNKKPPPLIGFPEPVAGLVMKALEKAPERRQKSAAEMEGECQACMEALSPHKAAAPSGRVPQVTPEQRTVLAQPAPVLPPQPARTIAMPSPAGQAEKAGDNRNASLGSGPEFGTATAFIPEGIALMTQQAIQVRQLAMAQKPAKKAPEKPLFWIGWALIGISVGLFLRLFLPAA